MGKKFCEGHTGRWNLAATEKMKDYPTRERIGQKEAMNKYTAEKSNLPVPRMWQIKVARSD